MGNTKIKAGTKVFLNTAKAGVFRDPECGLDMNMFSQKAMSATVPECSEDCLSRIQAAVDHGLLVLSKNSQDFGDQRVNIVSAEEDVEKQCKELLAYPQKKLTQFIDREQSIEKLKLLQTLEMANKDRKLVVRSIKARVNKLTEGVILEDELEPEYQVTNIKET